MKSVMLFNMPYDANQHELEILAFWQKHKIFERSVNERPADKPYVFYDGPPFATGLPHYGHILSSVIKDVVPRYWTMKGYRVRRRWGWDCHGLPIESLIEKELKISGKKEIEEKIGVKKFNDACRAKVLVYAGEWKKMVERIGRWIEFDSAYKTMDISYMESVWWALKTIWDKGLIYEGRKVLMYCPRCETPLSKAEVAMDHSYRDVTEDAVTVKFKIQETNSKKQLFDSETVYLLAWTTTPWTLPGNVALAVGEEIDYAVVEVEGEYVIVAQELVEQVIRDKRYQIRKELKGKEFVGLDYEPLFNLPAMLGPGKNVYQVVAGDFVTTEEGTGIVHTAVIYGEDDYNLGLQLDLPMVPMLDSRGHYNEVAPEFIRGQYYKKAEKEIKKYLEEKSIIFSKQPNTHSYPHCWRCDTSLIYNAVSSWFINIQKVKERMIELNEKINWFPEHLKHGRFLNIVKEAPDWNISRNRYWATALPFWKNENGDVICVGSIKELETLSGQKVASLHKDEMDKIVIKKEGRTYQRVPEVLDSWVEAASMPFAEWHYPFENKDLFEKRFPGQYIAEYIAQTRTWFYYMHAIAVILFDDISFANVVTTGTILNEKGEKLSKSKQNYTDPWIIIEQYGMDALRYYLMTGVVMQADNLFFNDRDVRDTYNKVINILWNVVEFYRLYAGSRLPACAEAPAGRSALGSRQLAASRSPANHVLDRWILARLNQLVQEVTEHMDNYDTVRAGRPIKDFIDDLSTWYVRRSRERFKHSAFSVQRSAEDDFDSAINTLHDVLLTLSKLMAPFTPFIAEKIYQEIRKWGNGEMKDMSVHLEMWPKADEALIDEKLLTDMARARKVVEIGLAIRKEHGIRVRQPLSQMQISECRMQNGLLTIVADELNVKEVTQGEPEGEDWAVREDGDVKVALNLEITEKLTKEGWFREIARAINQMRKEAKLTPNDEIVIAYRTDDPAVESIFREFSDELRRQTRTKEFVAGGKTEREIGGPLLWMDLA